MWFLRRDVGFGCLVATSIVCAIALASADTTSAQVKPSSGAAAAQTLPIKAIFLLRADYNPTTRALTIYFRDGSSYEYANVSGELVKEWSSAKDQGLFFNQKIRDRFRTRRLTPARKTSTPTAKEASKKRPPPAPTPVRCAPQPVMEKLKRNVKSVAFESVAYDTDTRCLVIFFKRTRLRRSPPTQQKGPDSIYRYADVPPEVFAQLVRPNYDPVKYFNANVRNRYKAQRVR